MTSEGDHKLLINRGSITQLIRESPVRAQFGSQLGLNLGIPVVPISVWATAASKAAFLPRIITRFPSKRILRTNSRR